MITKQMCQAAADEIGCEVNTILAVANVESVGKGFDSEGRVLIRFEGHKFQKYTNHKYDISYPELSYAYGESTHRQHGRGAFNAAFILDPHAALLSTSYGLFQIMGFNYDKCDFTNVDDFVTFVSESEQNQITAMVRCMVAFGLRRALIEKNWDMLGLVWNGPDAVKVNHYPSKLAAAHDSLEGVV